MVMVLSHNYLSKNRNDCFSANTSTRTDPQYFVIGSENQKETKSTHESCTGCETVFGWVIIAFGETHYNLKSPKNIQPRPHKEKLSKSERRRRDRKRERDKWTALCKCPWYITKNSNKKNDREHMARQRTWETWLWDHYRSCCAVPGAVSLSETARLWTALHLSWCEMKSVLH